LYLNAENVKKAYRCQENHAGVDGIEEKVEKIVW
jgi:hypothetical protein